MCNGLLTLVAALGVVYLILLIALLGLFALALWRETRR